MKLDKFNKNEFVDHLDNAKGLIDTASELGQKLATEYATVVFVGCGAPNRIVRLINHYVDLKVKTTRVQSYLPAEFIHIDPQFIDEKTIVVFGSYSGTTKETVDAAEFCKNKDCLTISITRFDDSALSSQVKIKLNYGDTKLGDYSRFIVTSAFISGFLSKREPESWDIHDDMVKSLRVLPEVLAETVDRSEEMINTFSESYHKIDTLFVVGHGPVYNVAYLLAFCAFLEMIRIHATPIIAADFFHGPFELLDDSFPVIVLIGEDETREEGIRVKKFCKKYIKKYLIVDSMSYEMKGITPELRPYFSTILLDAATRRFMDYYAIMRKHDKHERRYMGVVDY
ncbi:MAG: SIS domain-containing protein [Candidatus Kariarchaeaceae archaeon]|jgi:fructoselysine 6-phosphate deglycase